MFRGNSAATVDERGRVRLPSAFLEPLRREYGEELFLTSLSGESLRVYPMPVWERIEAKLLAIPSLNPARSRLLDRLTFYGGAARLDKAGRILVPQRLRTGARMEGEVAVLGYLEYLEIWNPDLFAAKLQREALTPHDEELLSQLGI
jgi:MraZ protein